MPEGHTTLYAKWTPDQVSYTVEHYIKGLDGQYTLLKTDKPKGYTGDLTNITPNSYTGFTAQPFNQQVIAPDGSTHIAVYYDRNSYELKFVIDEERDITINMPYGSAIVAPSSPYKQGYIFNGWDKQVSATMPDSALTYIARWSPSPNTPYMVKHYLESLEGSYVLDYTEGKSGTTERSTSATDRTYTGFTVKKPISQKTILPDGSTVVEVYYDRNSHPITWNLNGGEIPDGISYTNGTVKYGTPIVAPVPTLKGYDFDGWYTNSALTSRYNPGTMPNAPLNLYAKWVEGQTTYTVRHIRQVPDGTFPDSGGLVETQAMNGITGAYTEAAHKSYVGYKIPNIKQEIIKSDGSTVVDIYYYAYSYTVYFDGNEPDGGNMPSQTFLYGDTRGLLPNGYQKANYAFTGWNTKYNGSDMNYDDGAPLMNLIPMMRSDLTITLYAQWKFDYVIVSFNSNQGSGSSVPTTAESKQVPYGGTYGTLPTVSRDGYKFIGWYTAPIEGTRVYPETKVTVRSNHVLYALWMPVNYTVNFDANGGGGTMPAQTFTYDVEQNLTPNGFTREGYTFKGWNTKANGFGIAYQNKATVKNLTDQMNDIITLYAQWTDESEAAKIGSEFYLTLQEAVLEVQDGETIQLLRDTNENVEIPGSVSASFILDLNGNTLDGIELYAIKRTGTGSIIIIDNTGVGKITSADPDPASGTIVCDGSLNIEGGTIDNTHENGNAIYTDGSGTITLSGGNIKALGGIAVDNRSGGRINISGGTVSNTGGSRVLYCSNPEGKVTISGTALPTSKYSNYFSMIEFSFPENDSGDTSEDGTGDVPASKTVLEIQGGKIDNTGTGWTIKINDTNNYRVYISGPSTIKGSGKIMNTQPYVEEGLEITTSRDYDGMTTEEYNENNISKYRYLKFE
jgi:uncharacterized repeat protein (TIGR02543 family)